MTAQNIRTQIVTIQNTEYQNTNDSLQNREQIIQNIRIQMTVYRTENTEQRIQNTRCKNVGPKISELRSLQYSNHEKAECSQQT